MRHHWIHLFQKKMFVLCAKLSLSTRTKNWLATPMHVVQNGEIVLASDGLTFDLVLVPSSKWIFQSSGSSGHGQIAGRAISKTGVTRRSDWYLNLRSHVNRSSHRSGQKTKCRVLVFGKYLPNIDHRATMAPPGLSCQDASNDILFV